MALLSETQIEANVFVFFISSLFTSCKRAKIQALPSNANIRVFFFFYKNITVVIKNVLLVLTEDKMLISVQPEATMMYSVLSSSSIDRYVI